MTTSAPTPAVDLIEHAARIIAAKQREPYTAPYHWAGALWEAGMLVAPGTTFPPVHTATDLSARARAELAALARVEGPQKAEAVLITHQPRADRSCLCGWAELGESHAGHQAAMLAAAGVLREVTA